MSVLFKHRTLLKRVYHIIIFTIAALLRTFFDTLFLCYLGEYKLQLSEGRYLEIPVQMPAVDEWFLSVMF